MKGSVLILAMGLMAVTPACSTRHRVPKTVEATQTNTKGGIVWFRTQKLAELVTFYTEVVGCTVWLDQKDGGCTILQHGNLLLGFCQREQADVNGLPCFFYEDPTEVDEMYDKLRAVAKEPPTLSKKYRVYQFFALDPEGRQIEFQHFAHEILPY
jgi:predicted enzyme related to lactoylglutathione lyase